MSFEAGDERRMTGAWAEGAIPRNGNHRLRHDEATGRTEH